MSDELPFLAEYAKSSRASCKGCNTGIMKDTLRLAVMVQSRHFDGKQPNWYHEKCFFGCNKVKTVGDIGKFDQLRWDDQQKIKKIVDSAGKDFITKQITSKKELSDFSTEYAKSSRSTCRCCNEKIMKDVVRISKKDYEGEGAKMYGPQNLWYHVDCFVSMREEMEFFASAEKLPGFKVLSAEDQQMLKDKLPVMKSAAKRAAATISSDEPANKKSKVPSKDEDEMRKQNELLFKYKDLLKVNLNKKELQSLLEHNKQDIPSGESRILDRIADGMVFGALARCKECKDGQLSYSDDGYKCRGNLSEWTKCTFTTLTPERKPFKIPQDLKEEHEFLKKYKYVKRDRVLNKVQPSSANDNPSTSTATSSNLPLTNMNFSIVGKLSKTKAEIVKKIESLGGKVVNKLDKNVAAVISTKAEVDKMSKRIEEAKEADIHVVSEDYIDAVKNGGGVIMIIEKSICNWGSDPHLRIVEPETVKRKSGAKEEESRFTKSMPSKVKMTVKGAAAVDPDSDLQEIAHVLQVNKDIYNAILGLVDIVKGTNSYYKLQILESDRGQKYWVFRAWGRVGTTIGGNKVENMPTRQHAIEEFQRLYLEKTGNEWCDRHNFVKQPRLFYPLDIDYGQDDDNVKRLSVENSTSKLAKQIQDLIRMIFDVESMKKALVEFEIDLKKMPLGKLSRKQIESAYSVLTELQQLVQSKAPASKYLDAANRFYTLIPHDFGVKKPTPLDNEEIIKQKIEMLDNLLEIEVAYNLLKGDCDASKDPIDAHYEKLNTDIELLNHDSEEFEMIQKYVKNTHAATHNQYGLKVEEVFKINRHGEDKRFKPFKKLHNRQLLWHGSRITNYAGILSQGLRIAPPEAPTTGYMFGKGVYFADMVSKSANYCCTSKSNPVGLMLLCEVALGNMHELNNADFITKLPPGKHSTKGLGRTEPDPKETIKKDGVEIPIGKGKDSDVKNTSLLYNEYIVYDVAQINVKYLLKMKFNWSY